MARKQTNTAERFTVNIDDLEVETPDVVVADAEVAMAEAQAESEAPELRFCQCGCGEQVGKKARFRPGHDMRHKCALLSAFDSGNQNAELELIERSWRSPQQLEDRKNKVKPSRASTLEKLSNRFDKLENRRQEIVFEMDKLQEQIDELEADATA